MTPSPPKKDSEINKPVKDVIHRTVTKVLQTLARHSDVRLTLHRYAKARPAEIMAATAALPVPMLAMQ